MREKPFAESLAPLDCGSIFVDKGFVLTNGIDIGKKVKVPMLSFLIRSGKENLLFDAGVDQDDTDFYNAIGKDVELSKENHLFSRLSEHGVSPEEINYVFISHLHFDHAGLLRCFSNATVFAQRQEYNFAMNPPPFAAYLYRRHYFDSPKIKWQFLDGDTSLLPGITAISTAGHTPGHQSLLVNMADGKTKILTGDCAYIPENIEKEVTPGLFTDQLQAFYAVKRIKTLAQITGGQVLHSHSY
jgi:N-acyl homoserine lactone hydrolase